MSRSGWLRRWAGEGVRTLRDAVGGGRGPRALARGVAAPAGRAVRRGPAAALPPSVTPVPGLRSDVEAFHARFDHAWNKIEWHVPVGLRRGRFVDIGCGTGNAVAAAAAHGASFSLGIDRDLHEFGHDFDPEEFGPLCAARGAPVERTSFLEGDLFELDVEPASFDVAMMLDSAEHVPDPGRFFRWAHRTLAPGGVFLVDTCPLYYSPVGHHIFDEFPEETDPWVHLRPDFAEKCRAAGVSDWSLQRFRELNRVTHDELRNAFTGAGFEITHEHRSGSTPERKALLQRHRATLDLGDVPESCLFEDWILLVGRKG